MRCIFKTLTLFLGAAFLIGAVNASAHEVRPGMLKLTVTGDEVSIVFKQPINAGRRLKLEPVLPPQCAPLTTPAQMIGSISVNSTWNTRCEGGLTAGALSIDGLGRTITDVFVVIQSGNESRSALLTPAEPGMDLAETTTAAGEYLWLGFDHILGGYDHLLFVFLLLLLIGRRQIFVVITAFTVAHSITLAGGALWGWHLSPPPTEALIALSIAFLAADLLIRVRTGQSALSTRPWLAAFAFGLLHGFGFAGALTSLGLPEGARLWALFLFNIGVELGQLLVAAALLIMVAVFTNGLKVPKKTFNIFAAYAGGGFAMFWFIERSLSIVGS